MDGKYNTYENIAHLETSGIRTYYPINEGWEYNPKGEMKEIKRLYQKYHNHPDFQVDASMEFILSFLYERGEYEAVGSYYRNPKMAEYEECPDGYLDVYHIRNNGEALNGYLKDRMDLMTRLRVKGREKVDRYLTKSLLAILAVALNRLQHGVKNNLISVAYLT